MIKYICNRIYPDSPDRAGVCACTGDFLFATLLVWAGASTAAPAPMELRKLEIFFIVVSFHTLRSSDLTI